MSQEVALFIPCFIDQLFPEAGFQTLRILEKAGCTVHYNPEQTCCGQPACNAGFWDDALPVAEKFLRDFAGEMPVVAPSGSCVGFVRNTYAKLLAQSPQREQYLQLKPRLYELSEFLVDVLGIEDLGASYTGVATYHDACGALRECGIRDAPRKLLAKVRGLQVLEMEDSETCCGFGGTFAVKFEPISTGMADQKLANASETGADTVISTDWSCLMHLKGYAERQKLPLRMVHIAEVLSSGW
jgi:L-lactate dehydrogenase complex protein LldE